MGDCHALRCKARNDGWSLWWVKAPTVVALFSGCLKRTFLQSVCEAKI
ncbi:MAG: hypothetical protein IJR46_07330 [Neisseriaceae bacterium]|nr:hypothetical protein [Neisseriaceae bacterium]